MKVIKPQRLALFTKVIEDRGTPELVVSALAFFSFDPPGGLAPEVDMWKTATEELGADTALDLGSAKPRGEVLITGRAYPPGGKARPVCQVRVALGSVDKALYVVGDRRWRHGSATDPEPFTEMPITWARAFGGPKFPQNPLGRGHEPVRDERGDVHALPNIEDPKRVIGSPSDQPSPAGFGPYELTWPQRYTKIGTYDEKWLEERYPGCAADFDPTFHNAAPADQQIEGFFRGDEAFALENMHPTEARLEGRLPGVRARIFLNHHKEEIALEEVSMRAETVHLFPHRGRGILIFRGTATVTDPDAADVAHLLAAFEALGEPKPLEHYATVLGQRLDRKTGHLYALRDKDLLPAGLPRIAEDAALAEEKRQYESDGLMEANLNRRADREVQRAHALASEQMLAHGLEPPPAPPPRPPRKTAIDLEELPAFVQQIEDQGAAMREDGARRFAEMEKLARETCAKNGIDYDKAVVEQRAKGAGPPKLTAASKMQELRAHAAEVRRLGGDAGSLEAKLEDPAFFAKLQKAEQMLKDAYRLFAHHMDPAARLEGEAAARIRAEVTAAAAAREALVERDLTGVDLSGADLRGADLRMCFLERANLAGANLEGADLTLTVLARADLRGASLKGAKLHRANLGGADLSGTDLAGADLRRAVLAKADLSRASFTGADLTDADLAGATFAETDLGGASAPGLLLMKSDLRGAKLAGAKLQGASLLETALDGVDLSGADLSGAVLVTVSAKGAIFRGAKLVGTQLVKGSTLEGASFAEADLTRALLRATPLAGADFTDALLDGADLSESDLTGATLEHARARGARFIKTNLTRANLKRADLMETILQRARLRGASLETANLFRADMLGVEVDQGTITKGANLKAIRFVQTKRPHGER